jgi:2',3'-cyclic-nucleotide 2'-phosphodiesterase/3'-nucleotidase
MASGDGGPKTGSDPAARGRLRRGEDGVSLSLTILATSDLHGALLPYQYFTGHRNVGRGLSRVASLIRSHRSVGANVLLFDNGDTIHGTPLTDQVTRQFFSRRRRGPADAHPVVAAMNALGYDAATVGNHDFDFGLQPALAAYRQAAFPVLSANIVATHGMARPFAPFPPHAVLTRTFRDSSGQGHKLRIGVVGACEAGPIPPSCSEADLDIRALDPVHAVAGAARKLKSSGADVVVALVHAGLWPVRNASGAAGEIAALDEVDAVIAGHVHTLFPPPGDGVTSAALHDPARGRVHGIPAAMANSNGSHLAVLRLVLRGGTTGWRVDDGSGSVEPVARRLPGGRVRPLVGDDPAIVLIGRRHHRSALRNLRTRIGETGAPLSSALWALGEVSAIRLVAAAQRNALVETLARHNLDGLPLVVAAAHFRTGGNQDPSNFINIPTGRITRRDLWGMYPYPNGFCAVRLRGDDIVAWLEQSASVFATLTPGARGQPLLDPAAAGYDFDVLDGLTYVIDASRPPLDGRILDVRFAGRALKPDDEVILGTNTFRTHDGSGFARICAGRDIVRALCPVRGAIEHYLRSIPVFLPDQRPIWRLAGLPGTTAYVDTAPWISAADGPPGMEFLAEEDRPDGFRRVEVDLGHGVA